VALEKPLRGKRAERLMARRRFCFVQNRVQRYPASRFCIASRETLLGGVILAISPLENYLACKIPQPPLCISLETINRMAYFREQGEIIGKVSRVLLPHEKCHTRNAYPPEDQHCAIQPDHH